MTQSRRLCIFLNAFLFVDLILTIKNPFYPGNLRVKWYVLVSMLLTVASYFIFDLVNLKLQNLINYDPEVIVFLFVIVIVSRVICYLRNKNTS